MAKWLGGWTLVFGLVGMSLSGLAQQPDENAATSKQSRQSAKADADEATEKAVLEFVKEHQPELANLLDFLKKRKSKDYNDAMRESRKVRDRLLSIKDRDPEIYDVELAIWKNAAQIRLLAASVSAKSSQLKPEDRARLEELILHENELNIKRLTLEKARLESRANQLSQQITRRQEQSESVIAKSMKAWETRIERSGAKPKKKESP